VNTMPDATLAATLDHGNFAASELRSDESIKEAAAVLEELPENVSLAAVTEKLEVDGVNAFVASYEELLATVKEKVQSQG
jgi:transaldolase